MANVDQASGGSAAANDSFTSSTISAYWEIIGGALKTVTFCSANETRL